jgi:Prealbumin-like fold domain
MTRHPSYRAVVLLLALAMIVLSAVDAGAAGRKIFITKTDENFNGQPNVTFELYQDTNGNGVLDAGEPKVDTQVTDAAGKATFANVAAGKYIVHEVPPAGYVQPPDEAVTIGRKNKEIVFSNTKKPANNRVNDPTGDTAFGDGTHIFDFGPTVAVRPNGEVLVAWDHSAGFQSPGGVSGSMSALSTDFGQIWGDYAKAPTGGSNSVAIGQPQVVWDPHANRFRFVYAAVTNTGSGLQYHIDFTSSGGTFGFWENPVNVTPDAPLTPALAHSPSTVIDPATGDIVITYTQSRADGTSETMVTRSSDGGEVFSTPQSVSGVGHNDFSDLSRVAPNGNVYVTWTNFSAANDNTFVVSRSTDGGLTWGPPVDAATVPKTGTPGLCQGSSVRTVLGQVVPLDAPEIAVSPFSPNRVFLTFAAHGQAADEGDILFSRSTDGGQTWTPVQTVGPTTGTQFSPSIDITPDGRIGVAFYNATPAPAPEVDWTAAFFDIFGADPQSVDTFAMQLSEQPFLLWKMNPSFDTNYNNCFGMPPGDINALGSGFFTAWTDGRDPGPAGNNGIDPNIYFAHTEGPALSTELDVSVHKTATKVNVNGEVTPQPLPGARVTVTLFRDDGSGFDQIARKRPRTGNGGAWATSFARPSDGRCRIVVEFGGAEGRAPSVPVTKTFAC